MSVDATGRAARPERSADWTDGSETQTGQETGEIDATRQGLSLRLFKRSYLTLRHSDTVIMNIHFAKAG